MHRKACRRVRARSTTLEDGRATHVFLRKDRRQVRLELADIVYLESQRDYVTIKPADGHTHSVKYRLHGLLGLFDDRFLQIHRSFVVNRDRVTAFSKHDLELGEQKLPIGERYKDVVVEVLTRASG